MILINVREVDEEMFRIVFDHELAVVLRMEIEQEWIIGEEQLPMSGMWDSRLGRENR